MNKIQQMIEELCPEGVEFKRMDEVFEFRNGYTPSKANSEYWTDGTIPWFRMEDIRTNGRILSDSIQHISESAVKGGKYFEANSFILATTATIGEHALLIVDSLANQQFTNLKIRKSLISRISVKFMFYYLFVVDEWCKSHTNVSGFASVDMKGLKAFEIPLPPLPIQSEIVKILDKFSALQAELVYRKQQYEYYRDRLIVGSAFPLSEGTCHPHRDNETQNTNGIDKHVFNSPCSDNVKWMKMSEVGTFTRGSGLQKKDFTESGVGCIHYGQIYTYYGLATTTTKSFVVVELAKKLKTVHKNDIVFAVTSENVEDLCKCVAWLGEEDIVTGGHAVIFSHNQNAEYLAYYFQTEHFAKQKRKYAKGVKVMDIKASDMEHFLIPVPPLAEQERIAGILDRFEALTTSISEGLPAEIAARRQQYEHYRDKLLTFKKKVA